MLKYFRLAPVPRWAANAANNYPAKAKNMKGNKPC